MNWWLSEYVILIPFELSGFWWEISCYSYCGSFVCDTSFLLLHSRFSVFGFCQFDHDASQCGHPWVFLVRICWAFLIYRLMFSHQICKLFDYYLFKYFFSILSFWDSYYVYMGIIDGIPCFWGSVYFSLLFFSLCTSDRIIPTDLFSSLLVLSLAWSDLMFNPFSEYIFLS